MSAPEDTSTHLGSSDHLDEPPTSPHLETVSEDVSLGTTVSTDSVSQQIKSIWRVDDYRKMLPFVFLYICAGYMPAVFIAAYGAEWLGGCRSADANGECDYDYVGYNFYSSLFLSLRGVISFLFSGFIGRASDCYGRKPFLIMHIVVCILPIIPLLFTYDMFVFWGISLFVGLNGSNNSATPVMAAYLSDVLDANQRTLGYGLLYFVGGFGLMLGSAMAITIALIWGDQANFYLIILLYLIQAVYVVKFMSESLKPRFRKAFRSRNVNPFRPLLNSTNNPIVMWISIIQFLISLPETGVLDTVVPYILDTMGATNEKDANYLTGTFLALCGLGMVMSTTVILPRLKRRFEDIQILLIGNVIMAVALFLFACLAWLPNIAVIVISALSITVGLIAFPAANGILTRHLNKNEQGVGFGTVFAWRSLTFAFAPFSFGYMYKYFKSVGWPGVPYIFATGMCLCAIPVILGPLRRDLQLGMSVLSPNASRGDLGTMLASDAEQQSADRGGRYEMVNLHDVSRSSDGLQSQQQPISMPPPQNTDTDVVT